MAHSHAAGVIHRDIKPANIMLTAAGAVKVMDFGIARAVDDPTGGLTQTATVIGTAQYLSPEQASGEPVDLRSDLYSVGCLLFELLLARPPFVGESAVSVAYQHVREAPVPPSSLDPTLDPGTDAVVLKALAKDPGERYQSAAEMRADLDVLLAAAEGADAVAPATVLAPLAPLAALPLAAADTTSSGAAVTAAAVPVTAAPVADGQAGIQVGDEEEHERRRSPGRLLLVALAVFLLLGLGAVGLARVLGPDHADAAVVTVPDLAGRTRAQAENRLRGAGLVAEFSEVAGKSGKTVGRVVDQEPAAGGPVATGTVVRLLVNAGPGQAKIPDVVGQDVEDATRKLKKAGFTRVRSEPADATGDAAAGTVLAVEPAVGKAVALDTKIVLRYARASSATRAPQQPGSTVAPARPRATRAPADRRPTAKASASATRQPSADGTTSKPAAPSSAPTATSAPSATSAPTTSAPAPTTTPGKGKEKGKGKGGG